MVVAIMSGIDEQKPICPTCGKVPSYFRFRLEWKGRNRTIWLLDEEAMAKYNHAVPVVFDVTLRPISKRNEFIDRITNVRCNDCHSSFDDVETVDKLVTILKRMVNQKGSKMLDDTI